jgi:hypothetical protein
MNSFSRCAVAFLLLALVLCSSIVFAQDKDVKKDKVDTTLTLSIPVLEKQQADLQSALQNTIKNRDDAKAFVEKSEKDIVALQASINTINAVLKDPSFKVTKKKKE